MITSELEGLNSADRFYNQYHLDTVKAVIEEQASGATLFGVQCGQPHYFKFANGVLHFASSIFKNEWYATKYSNVRMANASGIIPLYSLQDLEKIYKEKNK